MQSETTLVNRSVRLLADIPELGLRSGEVGVVCSTWFSPVTAYEVEFQPPGLSYGTRALLLATQIQNADELQN
jgi:hypothetical protein